MKTVRTAKLFEAGSYPDKGLEVDAGDLKKIAASFKEIPVKVEHTDTVFDGRIGRVKEVWCSGNSLYGSIEFEPDMWEMIDRIGAKSLSVGIAGDLSALTEVSIVKTPRVADARIFSFSAEFEAPSPAEEALREENRMLREALAEVNAKRRREEAESRIEALVGAGKLTPACVPFARKLLLSDVIAFSEGETAGSVFLALAENLPASLPLGNLNPEEEEGGREFSKKEMRLLEGLGADPGRVAKKMEDN